MISNFSPIQNQILSKLKNAKALRYSELHPAKVANDLFNYHLQFLVKKGLVTKSNSIYALSAIGLKHIADPYPANEVYANLFKINVLMILSRVINGKIEILNQIRKSNPSYGKIGVVGGVVLKGESIDLAATRKLQQETGLSARFKLIGCERRIMYKGAEIFSDVLFPIVYSNSYSGYLNSDTEFGHNMWVPLKEATQNESGDFDTIKSILKVLRAIKNGTIENMPIFFKENIQRDSVIH